MKYLLFVSLAVLALSFLSCQEEKVVLDISRDLVGKYKYEGNPFLDVSKVNDTTIFMDCGDGVPITAYVSLVKNDYKLTIPYTKINNFEFEGYEFETPLGFVAHGCFDKSTVTLTYAIKHNGYSIFSVVKDITK